MAYDWMDQALCAQVGPDFFHLEGSGGGYEEAKEICARCPVAAACAAHAQAIEGDLTHPYRHGLWPTYTARNGTGIRHGGRSHSVHRIAWHLAHQREPVGHVETGCGRQGCVHPNHVEDQVIRNQYAAIFGRAA